MSPTTPKINWFRPKCLVCGAPADVLITDDAPYCAKHGLPILRDKKKSSCKTTVNNRSTRHASGYVNEGA